MENTKSKSDQNLVVLNLDEISRQELDDYGIHHEILDYASDKNETSFAEETDGVVTVVYQLLDNPEGHINIHHQIPRVTPMTFVVKEDTLYIFTNKKTQPLLERLDEKVSKEGSALRLLFNYLTAFTKEYFAIMETIGEEREKLIKQLRKKPNKKNLKGLANLQSGSVYILMGSQQNSAMLSDFRDLPSYDNNSDHEKEAVRDTMIEAKQLSNMCSLHSKVLEQLASSYNNVLSNNLNDNVTTLTIISIGIAMFAAVTSFYGMNVKLPFEKTDSTWIWVVLLTGLAALVTIIAMRKFVNSEHENKDI